MQDKKQPHIGLTFPDNFPDQIVEKYGNELAFENLKLDIRRLPFGGPYASMEWAIPTLIGVYILKPYFDEFLKEIAKDHYTIFKSWLKKISADTREIKVTTFAAGQSTDKLEKTNSQSKIFSIQTRTNECYSLKFLFDDSLTNENWDTAIDKVLKILDEHFTNGESDELTIEIKNNNLEKIIYARLKTDTIEWEFLDFKKIFQEKLGT
jgi:hypothetical protein